jgi:hypothetical protein
VQTNEDNARIACEVLLMGVSEANINGNEEDRKERDRERENTGK